MKDNKYRFALLALGDQKDHDAFVKFNRESKLLLNRNINYKWINYNDLLRGDIPNLKTKEVLVFLTPLTASLLSTSIFIFNLGSVIVFLNIL